MQPFVGSTRQERPNLPATHSCRLEDCLAEWFSDFVSSKLSVLSATSSGYAEWRFKRGKSTELHYFEADRISDVTGTELNIGSMVTDPQAAPFTMAIIGGGLAGLTLSIGLTRFGILHKIYESTKCFSEIGAGIAMGPNAVWALALIDPRLRRCFGRCATYNERGGQQELFLDVRYGMESDKSGAIKYATQRLKTYCAC
jgi:hypothetical protein